MERTVIGLLLLVLFGCASRQALEPHLAFKWHEVQVMCADVRRWLAEPMHDLCPIRVMHIASQGGRNDSWLRLMKRGNGSHDVDDRFRRKASNCCAADVLNFTNEPR